MKNILTTIAEVAVATVAIAGFMWWWVFVGFDYFHEAECDYYDLKGEVVAENTIVTEDGNEWQYIFDSYQYSGWELESFKDVSFEAYDREVEVGDLVYVRLSDNASDDPTDDVICKVGYDFMGNYDRRNAEFDNWLAESNRLYESREEALAALERYTARQQMYTAIYDDLYNSFSEVEEWEVTREGNNIHIAVKELK